MSKIGRPSYTITQADYGAAVRYIERARLREEVSLSEGYLAWRSATTPEALQAWCNDYLPEEVWRKMLIALRQSRKRSRDYKRHPLYHIDLTHPAKVLLDRVAKEMGGVTLSEAILQMEEGYSRAIEAGLITNPTQGKS